jgi:uncharacterized protein YndB with AHSA1/START domain
METLQFSVNINAAREKVWEVLWNDTTYRQWTAVFIEGSYAESDWKEGSSIKFLSPGGNGMFGVIDKLIPNTQMSFKHLGEIKGGKEEKAAWAGATENYYLKESNGVTELRVGMETSGGEMDKYFRETFPKALERVKEISEEK